MNSPKLIWPNGCEGAVSLSFDDGMESHLTRAIPSMNDRGLRGTFYLVPKDENWLSRWQPAQLLGHEMGNHTLAHPCSPQIQFSWGPNLLRSTLANLVASIFYWRPNLLRWTLADMEADILEAQQRLGRAFPSQTATSFAYPCAETSLGWGISRQSYVPLIARYFTAGRAVGEVANAPAFTDLHHLSSYSVRRMSGAEMISLTELAVAQGHWAVFTFHGIEEGNLAVLNTDFNELLDHLARQRQRIWTSPVAEVANYIKVNSGGVMDKRQEEGRPSTRRCTHYEVRP